MHPAVRYHARAEGFATYFTSESVTFALAPPRGSGADARGWALALRFLQGNRAVSVEGLEESGARVNYLVGSEPAAWRTGLPTYREILYRDLWPGVDLRFRHAAGRLKYEFLVRPGAPVDAIRLAYAGADRLSIDAAGNLVIQTPSAVLSDERPISYQMIAGRRVDVDSRFVLAGDPGSQAYGFELGRGYDAGHPVVIDPGLRVGDYGRFVGGSGADMVHAIAVDAAGNAYVAGQTSSDDLPTTLGALDRSFAGGSKTRGVLDAFVAKLAPDGALVFATYLGGSDADVALGIAVDGAGQAHLTGYTYSADFPTTGGSFTRKIRGNSDAFVAKLGADGSRLEYSTFLGGGGFDAGHAIAVDVVGHVYVTGETLSSNFPITPFAVFASSQGKLDAFITKLSAAGNRLEYSTYLGGNGDDIGHAIAISCPAAAPGLCRAYVTGQTDSPGLPTVAVGGGPIRAGPGGLTDAFVAQLNDAGSSLVYLTYLGGSGHDAGYGIAVDATDQAYVTGATNSVNFPTTAGAFRTSLGRTAAGAATADAFVARLNAGGSALGYATYLGGNGDDTGYAVAVDAAGQAYVTGQTSSTDLPTTADAIAAARAGAEDAFVVKLNPTGSAQMYATYLGGSGADSGRGIALACTAERCRTFVAGSTSSSDFPTTLGPGLNLVGGLLDTDADGFVVALDVRSGTATTAVVVISGTVVVFGERVTLVATVTATGGTPTGVVTFRDGAVVLGTATLDATGRATFVVPSTSPLAVGPHSLSAEYGGDGNFVGSVSASAALNVTRASSATAVSASPSAPGFGEPVTLTATVTAVLPGAGIPTGTVTFLDGSLVLGTGTLNGAGQAQFATSTLAVGQHAIAAQYGGDGNFTGSTSPPAPPLVVGAAATTTTLASSAPSSRSGDPVVFTATVQAVASGLGVPTGVVAFFEGTVKVGESPLSATGIATFTTAALSLGYHEILAVYTGNDSFLGSTSTATALAQTVISRPVVISTNRVGADALIVDCRHQRVIITGMNFLPPTISPPDIGIAFSGAGVVVHDVGYTSPTEVWADVDVAAGAAAVGRTVTVVNPDTGTGTSATAILAVGSSQACPGGALAPRTTASATVNPPVISIAPAAGPLGSAVSISGTGLGSTAAANAVSFAGAGGMRVPAAITTCCSPVVATVPAGAADGPVTVTVTGLTSNGVAFTTTTPILASVSPASVTPDPVVPVNTTLTLSGGKFATGATVALTPSTGISAGAPVVSPDGSSIQLPIALAPNAPAGTRDVTVTNPGGTGTVSSTLAAGLTVKPAASASLELSLPGQVLASYLPSVGSVAVTLSSAGVCTAKSVTPIPVVVRAQFSSIVTTPPANVTFTLESSALPGTATNEDCELPLGSTPAPDFSFSATNPGVQQVTVPAVASGVGTYQTTLYSYDFGGKVTITVSGVAGNGTTVTGTLLLPVDSDRDDLPDVFESLNGSNSLNADQNANGIPDGEDRFARDGLDNVEKYRGAYLVGPLPGATGAFSGHVRLTTGFRHLFARGRGYADDPAIQAAPGTCGINPTTGAPVPDGTLSAANPCPSFEIGAAFSSASVQVHNVSASFTAVGQLPRRSLVDGTTPTLDMATVTYDGVNCFGAENCNFTSKIGARNWEFPTLGFSTFGGPTAYGTDARVFKRSVEAYFANRPYQHRTNDPAAIVLAPDGTPMLAPISLVGDTNDNGIRDTSKEGVDAVNKLLGDTYVAGSFLQQLSALAATSDGCVQLPLVTDPRTLVRCSDPGAAAGPVPQQATKRQVVRSVTTHELAHAVGINLHTADPTDLMYQYSINWLRDGHFSPTAAGLIQIHNKGQQ